MPNDGHGSFRYSSCVDAGTGDLRHAYVCDTCGDTREFTKEGK